MSVATEDMIAEMVKAIVDEVDPVQIILFGSQAKGNAKPDSDVDLLVVERTAIWSTTQPLQRDQTDQTLPFVLSRSQRYSCVQSERGRYLAKFHQSHYCAKFARGKSDL